MSAVNAKTTRACSFCHKDLKDVRKLIAGPSVHICDECIMLCVRILEEDSSVTKRGVSEAPTVTVSRRLTVPVGFEDAGLALMGAFVRLARQEFPNVTTTTRTTGPGEPLVLEVEVTAHGDSEARRSAVNLALERYGRMLLGRLAPDEAFADGRDAAAFTRRFAQIEAELAQVRTSTEPEVDDGHPGLRLRQALGWILCGEIEDVEELFS